MKKIIVASLASLLALSSSPALAQAQSGHEHAGTMHGTDTEQMSQRFEQMNRLMAEAADAHGQHRMELMQEHAQVMNEQMQAMRSMMQDRHATMMSGEGNGGHGSGGPASMSGNMQAHMEMMQSRMNMMQMMMEQMLNHQAMMQQQEGN